MRETLVRNGKIVPDYMLEPEPLPSYLFFYWIAFWDLDTCRYDVQGPVPHSETLRYAESFGIILDHEVEEFVAYIRALDRALQHIKNEELNSSSGNPQNGVPQAATNTRKRGAENGPNRRDDKGRT